VPAIDPSLLAGSGAAAPSEWAIGPLDDAAAAGESGGLGVDSLSEGTSTQFSSELGKQIDKLSGLQSEAADASQALAAGTATDPAAVVMAVERARLSMQLASQLRTKGVEAINEIFRTQV
jgi:flagellar hook-basal body complex protein FliE